MNNDLSSPISKLSAWQLFRLLRRNNRLSLKRHTSFEQSQVGKVFMFIGAGFMVCYLIFFGVMFAILANESQTPGMIFMILPLLLIFDFGIRFVVQQTPSMLLKPYLLLPVRRKAVVNTFIASTVTSTYNWLWLCLLLPNAFIVFCGGASFGETLVILIGGMCFVMANSQWYLLVRTLTGRSMLWWLMPIMVYGCYLLPIIFSDELKVFINMIDTIVEWADTPLTLIVGIALLSLLLIINSNTQERFAYEEITRGEKKEGAIHTVSRLKFFDRFGQTGEYLKLEVKSIMRNKTIRSRFYMNVGLIAMLSLIIAYTSMYDSMTGFWCFYCFALYSMTSLVKVMAPEGNYIDLLLTHRENILSLLHAKYYFHCAITIVPLVLILPAIIAGKFQWLMVLAYVMLCTGLMNCLLFMLAIYNKQTLPLNQKITGKGNMENGPQIAIELVAMIVPIASVSLLRLFMGDTAAYITAAVIGLAFVIAHPLWLRAIYKRMMIRKYDNLEGFRSTRVN